MRHVFASDPAANALFGYSVALTGNNHVFGASQDATAGAPNAGPAYREWGGTWSEQQHLFASDDAAGDDFGHSVAVSGDTILVGAPDHMTGSVEGSAYVFQPCSPVVEDLGAGGLWRWE